MDEDLLEVIQQKLYDFSGIKIAETQKSNLWQTIVDFADKSGLALEDYCNQLTSEHIDFPLLISNITVNETYFYREEKQFDVLKNHIFPKFAGKKMNIWSAACSSGEESISLLTLALSCNIDAQLFATDIDDKAINKLKSGIYTQYSFRNDGKKYHELLSPYFVQEGDKFVFSQDLLSRIHVCKYNLKSDTTLPFTEKMDIVFLRNVFIYFAKDTRSAISKNVCSALNDNGYLFFSMNEIGCLDETIIPKSMYKTNLDTVYFFIKGKNPDVKKIEAKTDKTNKTSLEKRIAQIKEKTENASSIKKEEKSVLQKTEINRQQYFNKVSSEINAQNFESAKKIAEELKASDIKSFYYFLQGYIEYHADNKEIAEKLFSTSEIFQTDFWPTSFYHGMVLKDIGKKEKANLCLKKCMELLDGGINNPKNEFTLDDFSPKYIYSLCESMLEM